MNHKQNRFLDRLAKNIKGLHLQHKFRRWYDHKKRILLSLFANPPFSQGVTKRAGRKKEATNATADGSGRAGGKPQVKKAVFETTKKKEVGVSDLTLLSTISNEAINDNLKKRFENAEIYVGLGSRPFGCRVSLTISADVHRPCAGFRQSFS